jgi:hypothetical protein
VASIGCGGAGPGRCPGRAIDSIRPDFGRDGRPPDTRDANCTRSRRDRQAQIRVNAIAPGLVETKCASTLVNNPAILERLTQRTPLGRHAQPVEMAGGAVYLLSDASSYVTGTVLVQDGGATST